MSCRDFPFVKFRDNESHKVSAHFDRLTEVVRNQTVWTSHLNKEKLVQTNCVNKMYCIIIVNTIVIRTLKIIIIYHLYKQKLIFLYIKVSSLTVIIAKKIPC